MTSFNSHTYNVTSLLGRASFPNYQSKKVVVPAFQRPFSWEKSHVSAFWEDVITFHAQLSKKSSQDLYFLGPIVILPDESDVKLLDGQQRLATVTVLLAVLRDYARSIGGKEAQDLARDIHRDYLLLDDEETFALTLGELDEPFFRSLVQDDPPSKPAIRLQSHRLISQAKAFMSAKLREHMQALSAGTAVEELKALKKTLTTHLKMVAIQVASEDEAYLIFETLNDRGLRLGVPDLLLNYLMRIARSDQQKRKVRILWNSVVETLGTRRISTFVRHMWVSHYGDVKSQTLFREIRTTLEEDEIPSVAFASECSAESILYEAIFDRNPDILPPAAVAPITGLVHDLEADYVLPILLAGLASLSPSDFGKLAASVASIVVRHSVIANRNPNDLENALYQAARDIRKVRENTGSSRASLAAAKKAFSAIDPTDEQLKVALQDVHLAKRQASYVLYAIAEKMQSTTKAVTLKKNSIEHIFPENAEKNAWPNQQALAPFIWHLGNLSVLEETYNRDAGGKSFKEKGKFYEKSDIEISKRIPLEHKKWDVEGILRRAAAMHPLIVTIWPRLQIK